MDGTSRTEQLEKEVHLLKHRITVLEEEQLPRRVASLEPVVRRMEHKLDDISVLVTEGLEKVNQAITSQKAMMKGVAATIVTIVGIVQLLPFFRELLT